MRTLRRRDDGKRRDTAAATGIESAELADFEREYTIERVTQRDLMLNLGALLWLLTLFAVLAAGQLDGEPSTELQTTLRIVMAVLCLAIGVMLVTVARRFDDRTTIWLVTGLAVLGLLIQFVLSFYGPGALGGFYVALFAITIYCAQFLAVRGLAMIMVLITIAAAFSVQENYLADYAPHLLSQTVLLMIVLWGVAFSIHILKHDRTRAIEESELTAFSDVLTGLPNFRMMRRRAEVLLDPRNRRINGRIGIILIDLDEFRTINMLCGNREGDRILCAAADALSAAVPAAQLVARTGSDEFTVLVPNTSLKKLNSMASQYRDLVLTAVAAVAPAKIDVSVSRGVAISGEITTLDELMSEADRLLYLEKAEQENRPAAQAESSADRARSDPTWESDQAPAPVAVGRLSRLAWSHRSIQTRFLALAWLTAGIAIEISMHMPDAADPNISVLHVIIAFTFVVAAARYMMPSPSSFAVEFGDVMLGSVALAVVIYFFGGSTSPAVPIVLFILLYIGWFLPLRTVVPVSVMALVMMLIPTVIGPQPEISLMDAVTVYGGIAVTSTLLVVLYYNHYYIDRARALTMHLARIDPRTGSNNRRAFELRLAEELEQLSFGDRDALAVVLIDLGTSKNLTAGHARTVRDQLLTEAAQALSAASRDQDLVARLGGDEFVVVAPGVDAESARALAQRLTAAVHEALTASAAPLASEVLPSAGFALYGMHGRTTDELLAAADIALTTAKTSGRDPERVSSFVVSL